ncbi:MAG: hypothetical protein SGI72_15560 [Planctomycetota bacterium]|nr:hypothetical protein [Planctomycetota bacterium]
MPRQSGLFEATPLIPSASDVEWMRAYLARGERMTLPEEGVFKMCGGFHADFALVFAGGVDALEYHLCFGCMEVKIFVDGLQILLLDVSDYELLGRFQPYLKP